MSDAQNDSGDEKSTDEETMIPHELAPGQKSEDPVLEGDDDEDDDRIDLNDLA